MRKSFQWCSSKQNAVSNIPRPSSKPNIHYSFHLLAANTRKLIDAPGIQQAVLVGHSMGGMLAARYALMYPGTVSHLVLENPIGLEDYREFVPYEPLEDVYRAEMNTSEESIRNYHRNYYVRWQASLPIPVLLKRNLRQPKRKLYTSLVYTL